MMRNSLLALCLLPLVAFPLQADAADNPTTCNELKLEAKKEGTARIYAVDATTSFVTDYVPELNKPGDFGRRLMLFKKEAGVDQRLYYSRGEGDSYILSPTFFAHCGGYDLLILAEVGTEYSWGVRVFTYKQGQVKDLGEIPLALDVEDDTLDDSVIPHVIFKEEGSSLVISFGKNVVRDPGGLNEQHYAADKIEYRISNDALEEKVKE